MIDSSLLAMTCAPEDPAVATPVPISDLRKWTYEAVEQCSARDVLIDTWAREDYRTAAWRERFGLTSVVHEMLTRSLQAGDFLLRVHDGQRAWRIPLWAFAGWRPGIDLEMTWTWGRLWDFEVTDTFRGVASLRLPLLTTEQEADAYRRGVLRQIRKSEAASPRPASRRRSMLERQISDLDEGGREPDPRQVAAWRREWERRARWPIREAVLWVGLRDIDAVARTALRSFWSGNEREGFAGALLAHCEITNELDSWQWVSDPKPADRLLAELKSGLPSSGLYEGEGPMEIIGGLQWENLQFGVPPPNQRGNSDAWHSAACVKGQTHGLAWRGYWAGIRIERKELLEAFPPIAIPRPCPGGLAAKSAEDDSDEAVTATIERLSQDRGSPIPRNDGAKAVAKLLRARCREMLPDQQRHGLSELRPPDGQGIHRVRYPRRI